MAQARAGVEADPQGVPRRSDGGGTHQYQRKAIGFPDADSWTAAATITLPLFDRNQGNRAKAVSTVAQNQFHYQAAVTALRAEIETAAQEYKAARTTATEIAAEQLKLARDVLDAITTAYQAGGRPLVDLLDAERNFRETYRAYVTSRSAYWRAVPLPLRQSASKPHPRRHAMSHPQTPQPPQPPNPPPAQPPVPAPAGSPAALVARSAIWSAGRLVVALAITVGMLGLPALDARVQAGTAARRPGRATSRPRDRPYLVRVEPNTPLAAKIQTAEVRPTLSTPTLTVTGTVVASLRPGNGKHGKNGKDAKDGSVPPPTDEKPGDFWQFNSPEVLTTFTDWQKAKADITFAKGQFARIRDAAVERTKAQRELVATMAKLEAAGTETKKQLAIERATLRQYEIQEQKEIYEAETAIRIAERNEAPPASSSRPASTRLLGRSSDVDLVMADVPEGSAA